MSDYHRWRDGKAQRVPSWPWLAAGHDLSVQHKSSRAARAPELWLSWQSALPWASPSARCCCSDPGPLDPGGPARPPRRDSCCSTACNQSTPGEVPAAAAAPTTPTCLQSSWGCVCKLHSIWCLVSAMPLVQAATAVTAGMRVPVWQEQCWLLTQPCYQVALFPFTLLRLAISLWAIPCEICVSGHCSPKRAVSERSTVSHVHWYADHCL